MTSTFSFSPWQYVSMCILWNRESHQIDDVLQCSEFVVLDSSTSVVTRDDLEVDQMEMNRVRPATRLVLKGPSLGAPT